jgi:hypothetical protein
VDSSSSRAADAVSRAGQSHVYAALQRITGFAGTGRYFRRVEVIRSTGRSPLIPRSRVHIDPAYWKRRMAKWAEYRKMGVTELVRDVSRRARALKPNARVSAAVFSSLESADSVHQDWPRWLARRRSLRRLMAYRRSRRVARQLEWQTVDRPWRISRLVPLP